MTATYALNVINWNQPDLNLMYVERYPRYSNDGSRKWPYGGSFLNPEPAGGKKWPSEGETVTSVVHYGNFGYQLSAANKIRFELVSDNNENQILDAEDTVKYTTEADIGSLKPGATATKTFTWTWPRKSQGEHPVFVRVTIDPDNTQNEICEANNQRCELNTAMAFMWRYDAQLFADTYKYRDINYIGSFSYFDWANAEIDRLNQLLHETVLPTTSPMGIKESIRVDDYFPQTCEWIDDEPGFWEREAFCDDWFGSVEPWNHSPLDYDPAIIHEVVHGLETPDLYGHPHITYNVYLKDPNGQAYAGTHLYPALNPDGIGILPGIPMFNQTDMLGLGYDTMMVSCHWWLDPYIAGMIHKTAGERDKRHRGCDAVTGCPATNRLLVLDVNDQPLKNAAVYAYQLTEPIFRQDDLAGSKYVPDRPKFMGNVDENGYWVFPKFTDPTWDDLETDQVEGSISISNPFQVIYREFEPPWYCFGGYFILKIVGADGQVEFRTISQIELWNAYMSGFTGTATYTIKTNLNASETPVEVVPPDIPDSIKLINLRPAAVLTSDRLTVDEVDDDGASCKAIYVKPGQTIKFDGSGSFDPEGQPLIYRWVGFGENYGSYPPFSTPATKQYTAPWELGDYRYQFYVLDGLRTSEICRIKVRVVDTIPAIFGKVTDTSGNPIKHALVHLGDYVDYKQVLTDETGNFSLMVDLEGFEGKNQLLLTADAWQYENKDMLVQPGEGFITIQLAPKQEVSAIPNSTFDTLDGWNFSGNSSDIVWSLGNENHPSGPGHCSQTYLPSYNGFSISRSFPVTPGKVYNLNLWRRHDGFGGFGEEYWFYDSAGNEIFYSGMNTGVIHFPTSVLDGPWWRLDADQVIYRIKVPDNAATMKVSFSSDFVGTVMIDDIQLEEVNPAVGTVTGRIIDSNGNGIANAYVFYKNAPKAGMDGRYCEFTKTDSSGNFSVDLPLGEYYISAYKPGYTPSADISLLVNGNKALNTITLADCTTNLVYQRADMLTVSSTKVGYNKSYAVDGNLNTMWMSFDRYDPEYMLVDFNGKRDLTDIVLYREIQHSRFGMLYGSYRIDVMYSGNPSDPASWNNPTSNVQTIYTKDHTYFGYEVQPGIGICVMPLSVKQAIGLRIVMTDGSTWSRAARISELEIHGLIDDITPPTMGSVVDDGDITYDKTSLHATWSATDSESGIAEYRYAIGTSPTDPGSGYVVDWTSSGSNSNVTATGLSLTAGQTYYFYVKARNAVDLWSGVSVSDGITVQNITIGQAKYLQSGTNVTFTGVVCTGNLASNTFYIQELDRSAGIMMITSSSRVIAPGTIVDVTGSIIDTVSGEPYIKDPIITIYNTIPVRPLGLNNAAIGGGEMGLQPANSCLTYVRNPDGTCEYKLQPDCGLNNVGLLIRTTGKVTYIDSFGYFAYIDDGSHLDDGNKYGPGGTSVKGIRVSLYANSNFISIPPVGSRVVVTGVASTIPFNHLIIMIKLRSQDDIVELRETEISGK